MGLVHWYESDVAEKIAFRKGLFPTVKLWQTGEGRKERWQIWDPVINWKQKGHMFWWFLKEEVNGMVDVKMPHWGHDEHLCLLENVGYLRVSFEDYKKLVEGGRFIC